MQLVILLKKSCVDVYVTNLKCILINIWLLKDMGYYKICCCFSFLVVEILIFIAFAVGGCYGSADVRLILGMYLLVSNILTALTFWIDKGVAANDLGFDDYDQIRTPEIVLFLMVFFGAPIGALFGMLCCCCLHKIRKPLFVCCICSLIIVNFAWVVVYLIVTGKDSLAFCYK